MAWHDRSTFPFPADSAWPTEQLLISLHVKKNQKRSLISFWDSLYLQFFTLFHSARYFHIIIEHVCS